MASKPFRFKQFDIHQDKCAMKVGTDGVLLGALAGERASFGKVLEIGLGTGVVSLMLAQRFEQAEIDGVEIDQETWQQAVENAKISPWADRINFWFGDFKGFTSDRNEKYDLIVSNPPYFSNHLKSPNLKRNLAIHNDSLPFEDLIKGVCTILANHGEFWLILPEYEMKIFEALAEKSQFFNCKTIIIKNKNKGRLFRNVSCFTKNKKEYSEIEVYIKDENGEYSEWYRNILIPFLIIF
ncbi:tRNA (adenine37-N(6))-methyltransferase TrmN6 [Indibacter alkaliphilus LW1]|uniref:tRNA1(Val) (adenine(37)-N6)-methyltransferase n=1 Tax=Indibacter alkaliphilus (strain CCUG 57479 / KCTC 22604 / LW1) TaxID=1189612 RepID=S2DR35_INDAL|nr:methyltransferase [Indibacter alkaliphilus]EOZ99735.1 tRNA (adenine37-N(6))-methyltransferase TrmN6 [Indibacter alkaliphilus LW1]